MTDSKPTVIFLGGKPDGGPVQVYQCQKGWDELHASEHEDVRYCGNCKQSVHRVIDIQGFQRAVAQGRCVMIEGRSVVGGDQAQFVGEASAARYELFTAKQT